jgi:hypothetical protein
MIFLTRDEKIIIESKRKFSTEFEMKDLGMMHFLGSRGVVETK